MKTFLFLSGLHIRRIFRKPSFVAALLLPVLLLVALGLFRPKADESTLLVGIYPQTPSAKTELFMEALSEIQNPPVSFVRAESLSQLEDLVAAARWECGYILPADFDARLASGEFEQIITRVTSPATTMEMLSNTSVSAALLSLATQQVAEGYLDEAGIVSEEEFLSLLESGRIDAPPFFASFEVLFTHSSVQPSDNTVSMTGPLCLLISFAVFLFFILSSIFMTDDLRNGFFERAGAICGPNKVLLSFPFSMFLLGALQALVLVFGAQVIEAGFLQSPQFSIMAIVFYLLLLSALSFFIAVVLKRKEILIALIPFVLLAGLLLSPIFVDIPHYIPVLYPISLALPPSLFIRAFGGDGIAFLVLGLCSITFFALAYLLIRKKKQHF